QYGTKKTRLVKVLWRMLGRSLSTRDPRMLSRMLSLSSPSMTEASPSSESSLSWDTESSQINSSVSVSGQHQQVVTMFPPTSVPLPSTICSFLDVTSSSSTSLSFVTLLSKQPLCPGITSFNLSATME